MEHADQLVQQEMFEETPQFREQDRSLEKPATEGLTELKQGVFGPEQQQVEQLNRNLERLRLAHVVERIRGYE